jgi:hypothetical protein
MPKNCNMISLLRNNQVIIQKYILMNINFKFIQEHRIINNKSINNLS